ncbi:MAG: tRNA 5-methoxyuridine(34)/uridine 5-oxyacetic acid(34) synthase CmoB, partial [Gammaproteobacteria bacterium]
MIGYPRLPQALRSAGLDAWADVVPEAAQQTIQQSGHGNLPRWLAALEALPPITPSVIDLNQSAITVGSENDGTDDQRRQLEQQLRSLWPWRKGPFNLFGIYVDTEWRSDWKWDRVKSHITPLNNRTVLDVGCGSGYHCWRIEGEGAKLTVGIDPTLVYVMQYHAVQHYMRSDKTFVLPFSTDTLPDLPGRFDTIFSMGVLYHRRSPIDHLTQMWQSLQWEGELVLETLVIEGDDRQILMPKHRYAKMRNVWFIPSCDALALWL